MQKSQKAGFKENVSKPSGFHYFFGLTDSNQKAKNKLLKSTKIHVCFALTSQDLC